MWMLWSYLWYVIHFILGFLFWQVCFDCLKPSYVAQENREFHHMGEQLLRIVTFCHACMCSIFVCGYFFEIMSANIMILGRIYSTAFFVFDALQVLQIYNRLSYLRLQDQIKNPMITLFHHSVTILLMHGFMFQGKLTGLVIFYLAEIAMLPVLCTWRYIHINQEASLACLICRLLEIFLYGILRVLLIPPLFLFCILPYFEKDEILAWPIFGTYILVYVMNVIWFLQMAMGTSESILEFARDWYGPIFERNLKKLKTEWCQSLKS